MRIEKISLDEWKKIAEDAHWACFEEIRNKDFNTFDFAVVVYDDNNLCAYATVIEMDKRTAHMQHGGAFPPAKGTAVAFRAYQLIINFLKEHYEMLTTHILNTNKVMLKFAMQVGFVIVGIDCHVDGAYLHLFYEIGGK